MFTFLLLALGIFPNHIIDSELLDVAFNSFIYEDSIGYTWISSTQGWNKYDGNDCSVYPFSEVLGRDGAWVQSNMFESHDGRMFTTSYDHVIIYNKKDQSFDSKKITHQSDTLKTKYHISNIDTSRNKLYFSADNHLFALDYNTWSCKLIAEDVWSRRFHMTADNRQIIGCPWAERSGVELMDYDKGKWTKDLRLQEIVLSGNLLQPIISQAIPTGQEYILISNHGLIKWSPLDDSYDLLLYNKKDLAVNYAVQINGYLLVSIDKHGLKKFDLESLSYVEDPLINHLNEQLISDSPVELFFDSKEQLWLSHRGLGVQVFSLPCERIELDSKIYYKDHRIRKVLRYRDNTLVVATEEGSLSLFGGEQGNLKSYDSKAMRLRNPNIQDVAVDYANTIWVADIYGVSYLKAEAREWKRLQNLNGSQVYYFNKDKKGELNVSTSTGSFKIKLKDKSYWLEDVEKSSMVIKSFWLDDIIIVNYQNNVVISKGNDADTLSEVGLVYDVEISSNKQQYYLATDAGLYCYMGNGSLQKMVDIVEQPVFDLTVLDSSLWFHTADNIYIHDFNANKTRTILAGADQQFVESELIFLDEKIYIGTSNGMLEVPNKIATIPQLHPRLYIDQVLIDGRPVNPLDEDITIEHDAKELKIIWDLIDYNHGIEATVNYQLMGYDAKPQKTNTPISYYNLRPGNYDFNLSTRASSYVDGNTKHYNLLVKPPFYETTLFKLLIAVSLLMIGFFINYLRSKSKLKAQQIELDKERALSEQRATVSRDLHDELGSGLASIKYLAQAKNEDELPLSQQISSLSSELIVSMRDLMWSLDESNEPATKLAAKIRHAVAVLTNESGIETKTEINLSMHEDLVFNALERRNLVLIVKEAIANVIKHSDATKLDVRFEIIESVTSLIISDNGHGYNQKHISRGIGLSSIDKRCTQIGAKASISSSEKGTTIYISLPRS